MTAAPAAPSRSAVPDPLVAGPAGGPSGQGRQGGYVAKTCAEKVAKDHMPLTYPPEQQVGPSDFGEDLRAHGISFEEEIGARLASEAPPGSVAMIIEVRDAEGDRTVTGKDQKEADTFAAYLDPTVRVIFNPRIGSQFERLLSAHLGTAVSDPDRISEPDLIVLGDRLANGLRAMHFVDVKWHKTHTDGLGNMPTSSPLSAPFVPGPGVPLIGRLRFDDSQQLAHYYRHGEALGLTAPEAEGGAVVGVVGKEEVILWDDVSVPTFEVDDSDSGHRALLSLLTIYDRAFAHRLEVIANARARDTDPSVPRLTFPERQRQCGTCPWMEVCDEEMVAAGDGGHVTLLPNLGTSRARPLYQAGILDIGSLARHDIDTPIPGLNHAAPIVQQARVTVAGTVHRASGVEVVDLRRADLEVDFDAEADDPDGAGRTYMWGVRLLDRRSSGGQRRHEVTMTTYDDYSGAADGECRVFAQCWQYFQDAMAYAREHELSIRFYHYTAYERTRMTRLADTYAGHPGVPSVDAVLDFFDGELVVDLYKVLRTQLVWPTRGFGLKVLASWTGFAWADEEPGGANSMLWYRTACSDPDPAVRAANVARLRQYNADDVAAQTHLRAWVETPSLRAAGETLASVDSLPAPTLDPAERQPLGESVDPGRVDR